MGGRYGATTDAGVLAEATFVIKPEIAKLMLERAFTAGVPAAWVIGDEIYGDADLDITIGDYDTIDDGGGGHHCRG
jgi:hypothetical protein